ncbi:MAG: hypothetical protein WBA76_03435 [Phormidesmis sp.]
MSLFLSLVVCCVAFSWFRAKRLGMPWFSAGKAPKSNVQQRVIPKLSSGRPDYQSRAKRKQATAIGQKVRSAETAAFYRLNELTHSPETALRLIDHAQALNPERDRIWCAEKAIYDLKRDRMS